MFRVAVLVAACVAVSCGYDFAKETARAAFLETLVFPDERELHRAHFGLAPDAVLPAPVPRFDSLSQEAFAELAVRGQPFLLRETSGNPEWSCEFLARHYPDVKLSQQPYDTNLDFERTSRSFKNLFDAGYDAPARQATPLKVRAAHAERVVR
jgi:hypothetical protein